jgi:hypothetical protein
VLWLHPIHYSSLHKVFTLFVLCSDTRLTHSLPSKLCSNVWARHGGASQPSGGWDQSELYTETVITKQTPPTKPCNLLLPQIYIDPLYPNLFFSVGLTYKWPNYFLCGSVCPRSPRESWVLVNDASQTPRSIPSQWGLNKHLVTECFLGFHTCILFLK